MPCRDYGIPTSVGSQSGTEKSCGCTPNAPSEPSGDAWPPTRIASKVLEVGGYCRESQQTPNRLRPSLPANGLVDSAKRLEVVPRSSANQSRVLYSALVLVLLLEHNLGVEQPHSMRQDSGCGFHDGQKNAPSVEGYRSAWGLVTDRVSGVQVRVSEESGRLLPSLGCRSRLTSGGTSIVG